VKTRAVFVTKTGGPEVLAFGGHELPDPGPGEVRLRVAAAGVNYIDVYFRTGLYPRPTPFVPGLEGAGVVEAVGAGVKDLAVGDVVASAGAPGFYAEHVNAPAERLVRVPKGVDPKLAGAAMLQGMTAHYLTHGVRATQKGDVALVHAAAGGTGLLLVQMLARAGARVIGTCSSDAKAALVREAGASDVIRYDTSEFAPEVRKLTGGRGADVVYDSVGRTTFAGSLASLRPRGLCVLFGQSSGAVPPFDLNQLNAMGSLFVTRPSLAHYSAARHELEERAGAVLGAIQKRELRIRIGGEWPLAQAADAQRALESRGTTGKLLLVA
jgi:NADPH2:quinone reductase